jgi:hypothetical protein
LAKDFLAASFTLLFLPGCIWFLPLPQLKSLFKGQHSLWFYWSECQSGAEKSFTKWLQGMFPASLQSLSEVHSCKMGLFGRKHSLNRL